MPLWPTKPPCPPSVSSKSPTRLRCLSQPHQVITDIIHHRPTGARTFTFYNVTKILMFYNLLSKKFIISFPFSSYTQNSLSGQKVEKVHFIKIYVLCHNIWKLCEPILLFYSFLCSHLQIRRCWQPIWLDSQLYLSHDLMMVMVLLGTDQPCCCK